MTTNQQTPKHFNSTSTARQQISKSTDNKHDNNISTKQRHLNRQTAGQQLNRKETKQPELNKLTAPQQTQLLNTKISHNPLRQYKSQKYQANLRSQDAGNS